MVRTAEKRKNFEEREGWQLTWITRPKLKQPIMIEGLPGIGNVGKMVMDLLIEGVKANKMLDLFCQDLPATVYVLEDHLISLPKIEIYHKRIGDQDFLFMTGDTQPTREQASYALCSIIVKLMEEWQGKIIITTGGIGLDMVPEKPRVFCSGTTKEVVAAFTKNTKIEKQMYGTVGPIMGVTGLLLGIAKREEFPAVTLLAETFGHPLYLGLKGSREILLLLDKKFTMKLSFKHIDKEIKFMNDQLKDDKSRLQQLKNPAEQQSISYIG